MKQTPPLRTGRSSDFLSRLVALPSFMRFSVKKAAHAVLSRSRITGNPGSPQRAWDENDGAKPHRTLFARRARYCSREISPN